MWLLASNTSLLRCVSVRHTIKAFNWFARDCKYSGLVLLTLGYSPLMFPHMTEFNNAAPGCVDLTLSYRGGGKIRPPPVFPPPS